MTTLAPYLAAGSSGSSIGDKLSFWVLAIIAVGGAFGMISSRKAVHSALWIAMTMIAFAFLYIQQGALFLGIVQIVVYTGAVMMLFLFVLMLVGVDASDSLVEPIRGLRWMGVLLGLGFAGLLIAALSRAHMSTAVGIGKANAADGGNVQSLARLMFTKYVWAFEITSALLIVAAVGAMILTHRERLEAKLTQRELSERRFKSPTPGMLPPPGVYARHNAVDTPALLPDGSPSELSVPAAVSGRGLVREPGPEELQPARPEELVAGEDQ